MLHKKGLSRGAVKMYIPPPQILLIKSMNDTKSDKYFVKIKLSRDTTSEKSDLYDLKTALFDNGDPEEFFLFICNFQIFLEASGTLTARKNIQYLCMILRGEALRQLDMFYVEVGSTAIANLNLIILGLGM